MPEPSFCKSTRWLTCLTIDPDQAGTTRDAVILALEENNIESRPTWKPMHLQPFYKDCEIIGGNISEQLFKNGICLPSGTNMTEENFSRIVGIVRKCWGVK
jgi:dTDP-4-amino-4,6-dideoxygalactose transaminase